MNAVSPKSVGLGGDGVEICAIKDVEGERIDMRLVDVSPREGRADRARFEKLKEAYVKARYSKHYRISEEELAWLGGFVGALDCIVPTICSERNAELEANL